MTDMPDEAKIESLLEHIQPRPTERYYALMDNAAWNRREHSPKKMLYLRNLAAVVVFVIVLIWTIPPLRAGAVGLFDSVFDGHVEQVHPALSARTMGPNIVE